MILKNKNINEEYINSSIHGLGAVISIIAVLFLIIYTSYKCSFLHIVSSSIYGITLIMLYLASTIYHGVQEEKSKEKLKILDHACIYLLIAGTYTPFTLITLNGSFGFYLLSIIWALAIAGVIFKLFFYSHKLNFLSTLLYLFMGWLIIFAIKPLIANLNFYGVLWLIIGGLSYSLGTIFYLKDNKKYFHAIWHIFVLMGSISHFIAIFFYVIQSNSCKII
jgi:hemolysin III